MPGYRREESWRGWGRGWEELGVVNNVAGPETTVVPLGDSRAGSPGRPGLWMGGQEVSAGHRLAGVGETGSPGVAWDTAAT